MALLFAQSAWALVLWSFPTRNIPQAVRTNQTQLDKHYLLENVCQFLFQTSFWKWGIYKINQFSSVQSSSCVQLLATPWTAARQASPSISNSWSLLKLMSIASVMPSNFLILCRPLLLSPSILPSIRVFSSESALRIRWPKYWSFNFSISPSNEYWGLISLRMDWLDLHAKINKYIHTYIWNSIWDIGNQVYIRYRVCT